MFRHRVVRPLTLLIALAVLVQPIAGCGAKKKSRRGLTVAELRDRAKNEGTPDQRAAAYLRVARMQVSAGDKAGARLTATSAFREIYDDGRVAAAPAAPAEAPAEPAAADAAPPADAAAPADGAAPADAAAPADGAAPADDAAAKPDGEKPADAAAPAEPAADDKPADEKPADEEKPAEPAAEEPAPEKPQPRLLVDTSLAAPRLVETAEVFAMADDRGQARKILAIVMGPESGKPLKDPPLPPLIDAIDDHVLKARLLADAGGIYGDPDQGIGRAPVAKRLLAQATAEAEQVEERFQAEALAAVALGYTRSRLARDAANMVGRLEDAAKTLDDPRAKAEALAVAAGVQAELGKKEQATTLLTEAADAAKSISGKENKAYALVAVAKGLLSVDDATTALSLLKIAEKSANEVSDPDAQKNAMERVRTTLKQAERKAKT